MFLKRDSSSARPSARVRLKCADVWMTNDVPVAAELVQAIMKKKKKVFFFLLGVLFQSFHKTLYISKCSAGRFHILPNTRGRVRAHRRPRTRSLCVGTESGQILRRGE